ncbi:hypothetical protein IVIADoCa7_15 [Xanthomonas phage vB_Xar_IVIA-DoCa7]|uniref:Uncharacterized protein n=1 Tax=Xanthomonas phage vB_Xar_IVIA-DoCa7 TaxID=2975534 RepID=A0A9X9NZ18_9CAUD|nr:hypothetical protein IVIADoCa7_15 [Xanthomonas phage vB_Xar_IVIA-DoCa7]
MSRNHQMSTPYTNKAKPVLVQSLGGESKHTLVKLCSPSDAERFAGYLNLPGAFVAVVYQHDKEDAAAFYTGQTEHVRQGTHTLRQLYSDYAALDMRIGIAVPVQ